MNIIKSILLGSAAGLLTMSGARAAEPVEYVKVCSLAGSYYYIPGTDTCIKRSDYAATSAASTAARRRSIGSAVKESP
jgi:Porin subfamily